MDFSPQQEHIRYSFESFCKAVVRNEARNCNRELKRLQDHETPLSGLTAQEYADLVSSEAHAPRETRFCAAGYAVTVRHEELAEALAALPQDKRDVVLLAYFLGMTDEQIGKRMKMVRSTVQYKRTSSLRSMRQFLESED
jgi:RNA polymerase sigma factor (sigma-70 family)